MKNILLVEDTPHLSEEISDILRLEGYNVTLAATAVRALEIVDGAKPDLIITDLLMPVMDGFEFIEEIRAMANYKSIPVLILSAKTSEEDRRLGKEAGANAFLGKPCKAHELIAAINTLLGQ